MTITVLPMDATAGAPTYSALNARQAQAAMYGGPTGVFSARSGWRPGTPAATLAVTSSTWTVNPCSAVISPAATLYQGSYGWATDTALTGSVTAADATNPRLDILYIQVSDYSAGDGSGALSAPVLYLAGSATATPVAPTLPARSFLVGTIAVPKSGGGAPTVTLNQQYFVAAGAPVPVFSQAERDAFTPYDGFVVKRMDVPGRPNQTYDGTTWQGGMIMHAGSVAVTVAAGTIDGSTNVTFPTPFTHPPIVTATIATAVGNNSRSLTAHALNATTTGFVLDLQAIDGTGMVSTYSPTVNWIAVQMTPTTGAG